MNNNELENIETVDLGGNVEPTTEPAIETVDMNEEAALATEPVVENVQVPVQPTESVEVSEPSAESVEMETSEEVVNPQANVLNQIKTDVINAESSAEADLPPAASQTENSESIGTVVNENGETVEVIPVEGKSIKETLVPLVILAVGLLAFILLIPKINEMLGGI